jgi:hypothetical protein
VCVVRALRQVLRILITDRLGVEASRHSASITCPG